MLAARNTTTAIFRRTTQFSQPLPRNLQGSAFRILKFQRNMHIQYIKMRWGTGDNYAYVVTDDATKESLIIDPAEPDEVLPVLKELEKKGEIKLTAIVNTHHHHDHSGGNDRMRRAYPGLPIIAGFNSPHVTNTPANNSTFKLGDGITVTALHTPCHTQDSICYFFQDGDQKAVFTGDTLFNCGSGRFFEGTAAEMDVALNKILGSLPADTLVYPGHEYTASNIKFAKSVLNNEPLKKIDDYMRTHEVTTGIFTIGDELTYNPFMMVTDPAIQKALGLDDRVEVMKKLRELKNKF
ncbi:beta-lactamase-like protein [Limtongia smithiae]|uniref:beta-lactamase-like protein n=1 Tax=Limtongia smithiae TaxID=1125753 RepID=UPI0034CD9CDA